MMAGVLVNNGADRMLGLLVNKSGYSLATLQLRLYKNDVTPGETDTAATYTEATFTGYSSAAMASADWTLLALAFLVGWSLPARGWRGGVGYAALAALLLYAGGIERFQPLVKRAGRMFEWADLLSNHAGVFAGWALLGRLAVDPSGVAGGGAAAETAPTWGRG